MYKTMFDVVFKNALKASNKRNMSEADVALAQKMQANLDKWLVREESMTFNLKRKV